MREHEMADFQTKTFNEYMNHARSWKHELRSMMTQTFSKCALTKLSPKMLTMYAISTVPGTATQSLFAAEIPLELVDGPQPQDGKTFHFDLKPVFKADPFVRQAAPSAEYSLMCERQRSHVFTGVCDYELRNAQIAILAGDQLFRYNPRSSMIYPVKLEEPCPVEPMDYSEGTGTRGCSAESREQQAGSSSSSSSSSGSRNGPKSSSAASDSTGNFVSCAKICPADDRYLAYVLNKQVYIEVNSKVIFHTTSNSKYITNGVPSYIVQEELERFDGIWWSPNRTRLLYEHVNEECVETAQFGVNGEPPTVPMKYPRAGSPNATTSLRMVIIENGKIYDVALREEVLRKNAPTYEYITRAGFFSDGLSVWVQVMSRDQSECSLLLIPQTDFNLPRELRDATPPAKGLQLSTDLKMGHWAPNSVDEAMEKPPRGVLSETCVVHRHRSDYWVNVHNAIYPLKVEDEAQPLYEFIYCLEQPNGSVLSLISAELDDNSYCRHTTVRMLHADAFSTNKSVGIVVDESRNLVYFVANESHPTEWNLCVANYRTFSIRPLTERGISFKPERAHPKLAVHPDHGFICWMNSSGSPPQCRYYSLRWIPGMDVPRAVSTAHITLVGGSVSTDVRVDVPEIIEYISKRTGLISYAMVMRPSQFDGTKKYPVLHYVYGGPGIQTVMNDYTWINWIRWCRLGYVVVMLDNRGTANRGIEYERHLCKKMGSVEVEDQVDGLHLISDRTGGFMDMQRVIVHGWSYGGYMAIQMLAQHPKVYLAAIAGGAVYDWKLYDTAYTERYLGFPVEAHIYDACSLGRIVDRLPEEPGRLMLIHGLMDENVHFSHTAALIDALIRRGKWHELLIFPHERHGIRNNDASIYLDARMMHFAQRALEHPLPPYARPAFSGNVTAVSNVVAPSAQFPPN